MNPASGPSSAREIILGSLHTEPAKRQAARAKWQAAIDQFNKDAKYADDNLGAIQNGAQIGYDMQSRTFTPAAYLNGINCDPNLNPNSKSREYIVALYRVYIFNKMLESVFVQPGERQSVLTFFEAKMKKPKCYKQNVADNIFTKFFDKILSRDPDKGVKTEAAKAAKKNAQEIAKLQREIQEIEQNELPGLLKQPDSIYKNELECYTTRNVSNYYLDLAALATQADRIPASPALQALRDEFTACIKGIAQNPSRGSFDKLLELCARNEAGLTELLDNLIGHAEYTALPVLRNFFKRWGGFSERLTQFSGPVEKALERCEEKQQQINKLSGLPANPKIVKTPDSNLSDVFLRVARNDPTEGKILKLNREIQGLLQRIVQTGQQGKDFAYGRDFDTVLQECKVACQSSGADGEKFINWIKAIKDTPPQSFEAAYRQCFSKIPPKDIPPILQKLSSLPDFHASPNFKRFLNLFGAMIENLIPLWIEQHNKSIELNALSKEAPPADPDFATWQSIAEAFVRAAQPAPQPLPNPQPPNAPQAHQVPPVIPPVAIVVAPNQNPAAGAPQHGPGQAQPQHVAALGAPQQGPGQVQPQQAPALGAPQPDPAAPQVTPAMRANVAHYIKMTVGLAQQVGMPDPAAPVQEPPLQAAPGINPANGNPAGAPIVQAQVLPNAATPAQGPIQAVQQAAPPVAPVVQAPTAPIKAAEQAQAKKPEEMKPGS